MSETTDQIAHRETDESRSLVTLIKELRDEVLTLFRQEVELAKTEMSEKASTTARNIGAIVVGGAVALMGVFILLFSFVAGVYLLLSRILNVSVYHSLWVAPLIVGALVAIIGYAMLQKGKTTLQNMNPVPEKTVQTVKEDKEWIANKTR